MRINLSQGHVDIAKVSQDPVDYTTHYQLSGVYDGVAFEGPVTFHDGGGFDTELDHDLVVQVFTELDELDALRSL